ncbi:hypothetical protein [Defluviimonas salinarum]|uniref:Uncharacterized protein n=1 Tax=Defluviimonas salinarum TaxID=2992147 RepID=A0ABT3J5Q2_9RHOB|nr:hypothetical protein [Defluviimonas salinarum]MCW3782985.1 hypothetical protein [Defluviimonas salinarum]
MPRQPLTPKQIVEQEFESLKALVRNLLVENRNLKPREDARGWPAEAYYFAAYPKTADYVSGPLKRQAECILERLENASRLCAEMAADLQSLRLTLADRRRQAADLAFEAHDFGCEVEGYGGWVALDDSMVRSVFLSSGLHTRPAADVTFIVTFRENTSFIEASRIPESEPQPAEPVGMEI